MAKLKSGSRVYGNLTVDTELFVSTDATVLGNLNVRGNVTTINSTTITVVDPIAQYGRGANNVALTTNDGKDRGLDLAYYNGGAKDAFMGWKNGSNTFVLASNVSISDNVVTVDTYGDLTMGEITADGGGLSNIPGANVTGWVNNANYANFAGTVTESAQSNITSVGTLTSLAVGTDESLTIDTNGNISTVGFVNADGDLRIGIASGIGSNSAVANIYGNLNVTGKITGTIDATIGAKGTNTNVQFNDAGNINGSGGFTFNKTSNTVGVANISLDGNNANVNFTGTAGVTGSTGVNVKATTGAINLNADGKNLTVDNSGVSYNNNFNIDAGGNITASGHANILSNLAVAGGNFTVSASGNVDAKRGDFTSIKNTGLTDNQLVFTTGNVLGGDSGLTFASGTLTSNNFATTNANITGNITTKYNSGKLLTTDVGGNLIESSVEFASDTLTVANANVTDTATIGNLEITSLTTTGGLLFTGSASGNVTESTNLTFTTGTNTLSTTNITASGNIVGANLTANALTSTEIVYSGTGGLLQGDAAFTFNDTTGTVSANSFTAAVGIVGANLTSNALTGTEIVYSGTGGVLQGDEDFTFNDNTGTVSANNFTASASIVGANVTSNSLTSTEIVYSGTGGILQGDAAFTFNDTTGTVSANNVSVTVNVTAGNVYANSGTVKATTLEGTLSTAAQPNVTSLGNLTVANVTGNLQAGGVLTDNLYYANGTVWDLQQAAGDSTQIQYNDGDNFAASSDFTYNNSTQTFTVGGAGIANVTVLNTTNVNATLATVTTGNITTVNATTLNASANANITGNLNVTTNADITGNLKVTANANIVTDLRVGGSANIIGSLTAGDTTVNGNLTVTGTTTSVNTTVSQLSDPLFDLGNGANGAALTTDDGMDRGLLMHVYSGSSAKNIFMGYDNSNAEFVLAKNVTVADNIVTVVGSNAEQQAANLGDLRLGNIFAYNANFGGVVFSQGNVTLGAGSYLNGDVNGNISGDITVTGGAGAIQFADSSNLLVSSANFNFDAGNVALTVGNGTTTGKVIANLLTGTLTTAAQPNITSVGTLGNANIGTTLNVASSAVVANSGGIYTDGYYYANGSAIDFQTAAGSATQIQFKSSSGNDLDASANLTFDASTSNLTVNGNIITGTGSGGNISGANVVSATLFSGSGASLTNINGANVSEVALATNVTAAAQGNITSVGTLTSLDVTGNITTSAGHINVTNGGVYANTGTVVANLVTANYVTGTLTTAAQPNITSVGTLTSLTVSNVGGSGNITADNLYANSGIIGAQYLKGDGSNIANITGANVTGYVANANIANVAYAVDGSNITGTTLASGVVTSSLTTVGTLGNLTVTGNITSTSGTILAGNIGNSATILRGDGANITGVTASAIDAGNLTGQTLSSNVIYSSLTSVGTLTALTVNGPTDLGAVGNVKITGGTDGQYLQTDGTGNLVWDTVELSNIHNGTSIVNIASSNGNITADVAGSTIITIATTGLTVTGVIEATGNITAANLISNNFVIANGTTDSNSAITGAITSNGGIAARGNIYTGNALGFAHGAGNTSSAAYIQYNATAGSLDFIFN
jgi:hypothetical protein